MPLAALEDGVPWAWESFGEYLAKLDGGIGVNAGFLAGHCALRRYVMGADAIGPEATNDQVADMVRALHESIEAGGLGFSTTLSRTHSDGEGQPVASRWAGDDELPALWSGCWSTVPRRWSTARRRGATPGWLLRSGRDTRTVSTV